MSRVSISRRRFLGAVGATALTLPFLRSLPSYADDGEKRYLILLFSSCGVVRHLWGADPAGGSWLGAPGVTSNFTLRPWLAPLQKYQDKMIILRGLCNKAAGVGDPHGPGMATLWTGMDATGQMPAAAPSIDQAIAAAIKPPTPHTSIEFRAKSPQDYEGKSIYNRMIYDVNGAQVDPREDAVAARDALFLGIGSGNMTEPDPKLEIRKRLFTRLDGELARIEPKLCSEDGQQLEALRDGWSRLSTMLGGTGTGALAGCDYPNAVTGGSTFPKITRDHIELLVMSLACDLTRVASLQFSQALSPMVPDWLGISGDHHNISHQAPHRFEVGPSAPAQSDADNPIASQVEPSAHPAIKDLTTINQFYAGEVAYLCDRLSQFPVGNGKTLLDQCIIVWGNELDNGSDHDHWELPFLILGGGSGRLKTGQMVEYQVFNGYSQQAEAKYGAKRAHNDLHVTLAKAMGANITTFGNSAYNVGPLSEILT
ncbi:Tat (Twin-arginine translocation) pathway signal sequence domain protein [Minicystis rosea]|nr:Tat (Twin-arginine translocation) pathway signal sequence domain protein [Minicystis rosea]